MNDKEMSMIEHLSELRNRLIWIIVTFIIALAISFFLAPRVLDYLKNDPAAAHISWHVFGFSDALRIYMQIAFIMALVLTSPVLLYHVWKFVQPGLLKEEQRAVLTYIPFAFLLLVSGLAFGYLVLFPMIMGFMTGFSETLGATETYGLVQYFQFMFNLILPIGLLFEMPVIVMFLTTIRIVNPMVLVRFRKYAVLVFVIIAGMITPPDLVSQILVSIPLILLYEVSIWLSKAIYRKQKERDKEWEEEFAAIHADD